MFDTAPTEECETKFVILNKNCEKLTFSPYFQMVRLDTLTLLKTIWSVLLNTNVFDIKKN